MLEKLKRILIFGYSQYDENSGIFTPYFWSQRQYHVSSDKRKNFQILECIFWISEISFIALLLFPIETIHWLLLGVIFLLTYEAVWRYMTRDCERLS